MSETHRECLSPLLPVSLSLLLLLRAFERIAPRFRVRRIIGVDADTSSPLLMRARACARRKKIERKEKERKEKKHTYGYLRVKNFEVHTKKKGSKVRVRRVSLANGETEKTRESR